jgi:plasmid stability protein
LFWELIVRNVTITLDDTVADWARVWAAKHQTSVSRMLGELLAEKMAAEERYTAAMETYLGMPPMPLSNPGEIKPYPPRETLHER